MGVIVDQKEWNVIQKSSDGLDKWNKEQLALVDLAIGFAKKNKTEEFIKVVNKGASLYAQTSATVEGYPTHIPGFLAFHNKKNLLEELLKVKIVNLSHKINGIDALDCAIMGRHDEMMSFLINRQNYDLKSRKIRETPKIILSTKMSYLYAVELLLSRKANPNIQDENNKTALWYNLKINPQTPADIQIGRLLIDYGATTPDDIDIDEMEVEQQAMLEVAEIKQELQQSPSVKPRSKPKML